MRACGSPFTKVKNQINEWSEQQRQEDEAAADAQANKRQLKQPVEQSKPAEPNNENRK